MNTDTGEITRLSKDQLDKIIAGKESPIGEEIECIYAGVVRPAAEVFGKS